MNLILDSRDQKFVLQELLHTEDLCRMPVWSDFSPDMFDMVLNEAQRLAVEVSIVDRLKDMAYMKEKVAPYKVPKVIQFMTALPLSAVGKVLRRELRKIMSIEREN